MKIYINLGRKVELSAVDKPSGHVAHAGQQVGKGARDLEAFRAGARRPGSICVVSNRKQGLSSE